MSINLFVGMVMVVMSLILIKLARKVLKLVGFALMIAGIYITVNSFAFASFFANLFK